MLVDERTDVEKLNGLPLLPVSGFDLMNFDLSSLDQIGRYCPTLGSSK